MNKEETTMRYFKAFHPGMICNGKQYAENTTYEEQGADECCEAGVMHFCEMPLDCLDYYNLIDNDGKIVEFAKVEPLDKVLTDGNKRASKKLHIGAKLSLKEIINAQVDIQIEKSTPAFAASGDGSQLAASGNNSQLAASGYGSQLAASGYGSQLAASGDGSQLAASGDGSKLAASGNNSKLAASGYGSQLAASGDGSQLAASGDGSKLAASGYGSKLAASGDGSQLAASGNNSKLAASGNDSQLVASGNDSIVAAIGVNNVASASLGSWIVLAEYDNGGKPICVKAAQVDGEKLKPNVFYRLVEGEFAEANV
jgi:hypothetical protein